MQDFYILTQMSNNNKNHVYICLCWVSTPPMQNMQIAVTSTQIHCYTVTRKGNASYIWKVATMGFLYHGSDCTFCLDTKSKPVDQM